MIDDFPTLGRPTSTAKPSAERNVLATHELAFRDPQSLQPRLEGEVLHQAPEQRVAHVDVAVHESWHEELARGVDDLFDGRAEVAVLVEELDHLLAERADLGIHVHHAPLGQQLIGQ